MRCILLMCCLWSLVASAGSSMQDLEALAKRGSWVELLERAEDVAPPTRDDRWRELVRQAAVAVVKSRPDRAPALAERYGFLASSPEFSQVLSQRRAVDLEACLAPPPPGTSRRIDPLDSCVDALLASTPSDEVLVKATEVLSRDSRRIAALPVWAALAARSPKTCDDARLRQAVLEGLELPFDERRAALARTLAFEVCWAKTAGPVKEAMVHPSSYLLRNACPALKARNALTELQKDLCDDER
jgi:hypothetical protein